MKKTCVLTLILFIFAGTAVATANPKQLNEKLTPYLGEWKVTPFLGKWKQKIPPNKETTFVVNPSEYSFYSLWEGNIVTTKGKFKLPGSLLHTYINEEEAGGPVKQHYVIFYIDDDGLLVGHLGGNVPDFFRKIESITQEDKVHSDELMPFMGKWTTNAIATTPNGGEIHNIISIFPNQWNFYQEIINDGYYKKLLMTAIIKLLITR